MRENDAARAMILDILIQSISTKLASDRAGWTDATDNSQAGSV